MRKTAEELTAWHPDPARRRVATDNRCASVRAASVGHHMTTPIDPSYLLKGAV